MLLHGRWTDDDDPQMSAAGGAFRRPASTFRNSVGRGEDAAFPAEPGRYQLFTAPSCPWAHRTVIARRLKRLDAQVSWSQSDIPRRQGWAYSKGIDDFGLEGGVFNLHQLYTASDADFTGRVTVPVLWDRKSRTIVNNESSEILRMFDQAFEPGPGAAKDLVPPHLAAEIDELNQFIYERVNNGVYRCGFAKSQNAYATAFKLLFAALDELEQRLAGQRYLLGDTITESDVRLFTTLVRFDSVYYVHFKCNLRRIVDYQNLWGYLRDLYQTPGFGETVDMPRIKAGYFAEQRHLNPLGIVPEGPELDFLAPHERRALTAGDMSGVTS